MNTIWTENLNRCKILAQSDLEPSPGRKLSREVEIDSQTIPKPAKIEKMRKYRKRAQNCRIHPFFDVQNAFSLRGPASALNDLLRQQKGRNFCSFIVISYIDSMPEDYSITLEYICSTSLPGGNQVDGLPPASSSWHPICILNNVRILYRWEHGLRSSCPQETS